MNLLTTSIGKEDLQEPTLLLGEWCNSYSQLENYKHIDHITCGYIWSDHNQLEEDYKIIQAIYRKYLTLIAHELNQIHQLEYTDRQWEIIVGPWLRPFISILYEKYKILKVAIETHDINNVLHFNPKKNNIPKNTKEFFNNTYSDSWNQEIYLAIIKKLKLLEIKNRITSDIMESVDDSSPDFSKKDYVKNVLGTINAFFISKNKTIIAQMDMKKITLLRFSLSIGVIPTIFLPTIYKISSPDNRLRDNFKIPSSDKKFELLCSELIPLNMPKSLLEDFQNINKLVSEKYPSKVKTIITTVGYYLDDVFKIWVSRMVANGSKYIINQHGGHYGTSSINDSEELQMSTADYFLSWGWDTSFLRDNAKIKPLASIKLSNLIKTSEDIRSKGNIVFPLSVWPKYGYRMYAAPTSVKQLVYFDQVFTFCKHLKQPIKNKLVLRLPAVSVNRGDWDLKDRIKDQNLGHTLNRTKPTFAEDLRDASLAIINTNSTTILETLVLNIPTIMILDYKMWAISDNAIKDFRMLQKAGIIFETAKEASIWVNDNFHIIDSWWAQNQRQKAKDSFVQKYALSSKTYLKDWRSFLRSLN